MIQAKLEHPTETGVSVMVTWIPKDLRTKQGDRITAGKDPQVWTIAEQYTQTMEATAINHNWKVGGLG